MTNQLTGICSVSEVNKVDFYSLLVRMNRTTLLVYLMSYTLKKHLPFHNIFIFITNGGRFPLSLLVCYPLVAGRERGLGILNNTRNV